MSRRVLLLCGPPGAGKSTLARATGLTVYDYDDPMWGQDEARFTAALEALRHDSQAQAVVIRAGATHSARLKAAALVDATEVQVLATPAAECVRRVRQRGRVRPPMAQQVKAVHRWWQQYEPAEQAEGWSW